MNQPESRQLNSSHPTTDFASDSDYDLLEIMTWKDTDPSDARDAWAEFYRRHAEYLYSVCRKHAKGLGGDEAAQDLTAETFVHVFDSAAASFRPQQSDDTDSTRRHVRAWLGTIAHNLACNAYRGNRLDECDIGQDQLNSIPNPGREFDSEKSQRLVSLMETVLSERERDVLRITSHYIDFQNANRKLPGEVLDDLGRQWGITRENIRQIKSRAIRKLENAWAAPADENFMGQKSGTN